MLSLPLALTHLCYKSEGSAVRHFTDWLGDLATTHIMVCEEMGSKFQMTPLRWKCRLDPGKLSVHLIATLISEHILFKPQNMEVL